MFKMFKAKIYYCLRVKLPGDPPARFPLLADTHRLLGTWMLPGEAALANVLPMLEQVYRCFQGENWSPRGEARNIIRAAGVSHTSMSTGDIVELATDDAGVYLGMYEVAETGWRCVSPR